MELVIREKSFPFRGRAVDVLTAFRHAPCPFLLESSLRHPQIGRFSFIGADPFLVIDAKRETSLRRARQHFYRYACPGRSARHPFPGGMMGFLTYEFGLAMDPGLRSLAGNAHAGAAAPVPGYLFGFYDCVIMIDHQAGRLSILSTGFPERKGSPRLKRAGERLKEAAARLQKGFSAGRNPAPRVKEERRPADMSGLKSDFKKSGYLKAVRRALEHIRRGDIYQVNLSQRFCFDGAESGKTVDPFALYRTLRRVSPSCFGGYFDAGSFQIVSSSPERFLRTRDGIVLTRPMKGTRPRGRDPVRDRRNARELWKSRKDTAELLMITDLERNDLGRVCRYGSVRVDAMRSLEKYASVFQTTSSVSGRLAAGRDAFDCLEAAFPGGSITGCPKIRAMQIIAELEPVPRSIYTGALGYVGFSGDMDFNILIRTFLARGNKISFHAGGGIVADSVPQREYEETLVKAAALKRCLAMTIRERAGA